MSKTATKTSRSIFYYYNDLMELLGCSRAHAYKVISQLNAELEKMGKITVSGRVPKKYFHERFYADISLPAPAKSERRAL